VARIGYKDPDEAARENPEEFKKAVNSALSVWDYIINYIFDKNKGTTGQNKAKISRQVVPILASIGDKIVQAHYANLVAKRLGVSVEAVSSEIVSKGSKEAVKTGDLILANQADKKDRRTILEERLLSVAFRVNPKLILKKEVSKLFTTPFSKRIVSELKNFFALDKEFDPSLFAAKLPRELLEGFTSLILKEIDGLDDKLENNKYALMTSLTGADFLSTMIGGMRRSSISRQASAISIRLISFGKPKAIWVLRWEISQFMTSLRSLTLPCRFKGRSKIRIGNFFIAPRCLMIAVTS